MTPDDNTIRAAMADDPEAAARCTAAGYALPCPFCGKDPATHRIEIQDSPDEIIIECIFCEVSIARHGEGKALAAWNTRARLPGLGETDTRREKNEGN